MDAPDATRDLPADTLPPELEGLVTLQANGDLLYTRTVPTPERGLAVGALGAGIGGLALLALGLGATGDVQIGLLLSAMMLPFPLMFAWFAFRQVVEEVVVSRSGVGGTFGFAWKSDDQLWLEGELGAGRMRLDRVTADGARSTLRAWIAVRNTRDRGWDVDSIRWFAQRVAERAGVPLMTDVPADEDWQRVDAERTARAHAKSTAMEPRFAALLRGPPEWPEETWEADHVMIRIRGGAFGVYLETPQVSYQDSHVLRVDAQGVRLGEHQLRRGLILGIRAWFGTIDSGKHRTGVAEVRALTPDGHRVLVQRRLDATDPGVIVGAAAAIQNALDRAGAARPTSGDASEVPEALRQVAGLAASRRETGGES